MAANTLLSELGGKVIMGSQHDEIVETWLADGTAKAGWLVGLSGTDLVVSGTDVGGLEYFIGIALPRYDTDVDTSFTGDDLIDVVIPISGHYYAVLMANPSATLEGATPLSWGATAGAVHKCATIQGSADVQIIAYNKEQVITGTTFALVRWA